MDDIAIHTKPHPWETDEQHHACHTKLTHHVLDKSKFEDLYLKPKKCAFAQEESTT